MVKYMLNTSLSIFESSTEKSTARNSVVALLKIKTKFKFYNNNP